jgi:hypothetical protein
LNALFTVEVLNQGGCNVMGWIKLQGALEIDVSAFKDAELKT